MPCHFYYIQRFELFNNINKAEPSFTQLDTKEQVNILLYGYPLNKSNTSNQDIIKILINTFGRFDKRLINLNQWLYVLLFFFFPICLLYVFFVFVFVFCFCVFFLLENKCKFATYNWLQIWCINTLLLINLCLYLFISSILICDQL